MRSSVSVLLLFIFVVVDGGTAPEADEETNNGDFTLSCRPGYKVAGIRRVNSFYQKNTAGSLALECVKIAAVDEMTTLKDVQCHSLTTTPQCHGVGEGCAGDAWLGGFQAFVIENATRAVLLDPICCTSPSVKIQSLSCASERLNNAREPFEHEILADDLVYRGMQCWHQYNSNNTLVDLVWKMEVCQYTTDYALPTRSFNLEHCAPCNCHCGIDVCADGKEPVRIVHKQLSHAKCQCDCLCHHLCV